MPPKSSPDASASTVESLNILYNLYDILDAANSGVNESASFP